MGQTRGHKTALCELVKRQESNPGWSTGHQEHRARWPEQADAVTRREAGRGAQVPGTGRGGPWRAGRTRGSNGAVAFGDDARIVDLEDT